jgi:ceramide glucosyltransferase
VEIGNIASAIAVLSATVTIATHGAAHLLLAGDRHLRRGKLPISVLKPLKGAIEMLEENLESFCQQDHSQYELILGAANSNDPAIAVAQRVRARHPELVIKIVTGEWSRGLNPKVRLLRRLFAHAKYGAILISDDNVRVRRDYLSVMAGALELPNTGLVSNVIVGVGGRTMGAICENLQLNTFVISNVAGAYLLGVPVTIGKSMLMRRDALVNAGGFGAVADVLAEDHLLGQAIRGAGYKTRTLGHPVFTTNVTWSLQRTYARHQRWCKMRANVAPLLFPLELLLQPLMLSLFASLVIRMNNATVVPSAFVVPVVSAVLATLSEVFLLRHLLGRELRVKDIVGLPVRSVVAVASHIGSGLVSVVSWRGENYRIGKQSRLIPLNTERTLRVVTAVKRAA